MHQKVRNHLNSLKNEHAAILETSYKKLRNRDYRYCHRQSDTITFLFAGVEGSLLEVPPLFSEARSDDAASWKKTMTKHIVNI